MKKTLSILILISFLIFTQCAIDGCGTESDNKCTACNEGYKITLAGTCIKGCKTADTAANSAKCSECDTAANLSTDKLSCIANCKETGDNSGLCKTCADGYTLSTDKTTCTSSGGNGNNNSGFGLHYSLIILALLLLF